MHENSTARWLGSLALAGATASITACGSENESGNEPRGTAGFYAGFGGQWGLGGSLGGAGFGAAGSGAAGASAYGGAGFGAGGIGVGAGGIALGGSGGASFGGVGGQPFGGLGGGVAGGAGGDIGGSGTGGDGGAGGGASGGTSGSGGQTLPPITDYSQAGPFSTTRTNGTGPGNAYTIFRPEPLGDNGFLHPPLIWGPGIATQVSSYVTFLTNVASHGFVVVAVNTLSSGPGAAANRQPMIDGLDWILAQNDEPGIFQGKLDVKRAVSMGYSIGGTAAVQVGEHPAVVTTVSIHGHSATSALHGPLFQTTGTADNVGLPLQQQTYDASQVQTFLATLDGATHFEILSNGGGRERAPIVAWLRYWVFNDQGARNFFYGDACTVCIAPWTNPQRKNWQ
jgi:hypothetical protein